MTGVLIRGGETGPKKRLPYDMDTKTGALQRIASHFQMLRGGRIEGLPGVF